MAADVGPLSLLLNHSNVRPATIQWVEDIERVNAAIDVIDDELYGPGPSSVASMSDVLMPAVGC
jgi:hypothetical protein